MFAGAGCASAAAAVGTTRATAAVETAAESGAGEEHPYEMTLARAYLEKAREESSEAQYDDSIRFSRTAKESAEKALTMQREHRAGENAPAQSGSARKGDPK